jgi:hypothetical protein
MRLLQTWTLSAVALIAGVTTALDAQRPDSVRTPTAGFVGRMISELDSTPVRSADIRLVFVDSVKQVHARNGRDSLDVFADSARTRVTVTDSTGAFAIWRLPAGRYLLHVRRLGYEPLQGALVVDSGTVSATMALRVVSRVLAKVVVTETSVDRVKERLEMNGFIVRSRMGLAATFVERADVLRLKRQNVGELLSSYGIYDASIVLDRMPFEYEWVRDYPADLVIGIEIYRHSRPTEFNGTRSAATMLSPGGMAASMRPLVVIWTYIP